MILSQGFTETPYFLTNLEAGLHDAKFPRGSTLWQYVDDSLLRSSSQASSWEDSIQLLTLSALKGLKIANGNCSLPKPRFNI